MNNQPTGKAIGGARELAAIALTRVYTQSAYARAALDAEISKAQASSGGRVDPRDIALATELLYGVLRTGPFLLSRLAHHQTPRSNKGIQLAPAAQAHLLMGAYSIAFLDRIPPFAAVNEAVSGVRTVAGKGPSAFCNAILRRFSEEISRSGRPSLGDAVHASVPSWLSKRLSLSLGKESANAYIEAGPVPPPLVLCVWPGEDQGEWLKRIQEAAPEGMVQPCQHSPHGILLSHAGDPRKLPGAGKAWIVQEEGAQLVALSLSAQPGERILDACAGHGNKAWLLAYGVGERGAVDAADLYASKLRELREGPSGAKVSRTYTINWEEGVGEVPGDYDAILLDAPCSGTGTLRRRPEIALHRKADDIKRLSALQTAILKRAASRARVGGRLVYAVCSVLREEAEEVVEQALRPGSVEGRTLILSPFEDKRISGMAGEGQSMLRLLPHVHGTDGYFLASFRVLG